MKSGEKKPLLTNELNHCQNTQKRDLTNCNTCRNNLQLGEITHHEKGNR